MRPYGSHGYDRAMPIYVVADLHGAHDALRKAVPEGATLLLLGDLINFLDYTSMSGILTEVYPVADVEEVVRLRTEGRVAEARDLIAIRSRGREREVGAEISRRVDEEYARVFEVLPDPTYIICGNVDQPRLVGAMAAGSPGAIVADGKVFEIEGERFGFIGGALPTPMHVAGEIDADEMRRKVGSLGDCDVLCSHIPPAVPELCYDTRAEKAELGSEDLLAYIRDVQPRLSYFGHVHQPLLSSMRVGRTVCINVGYFRRTQRAWRHGDGERVTI